ncbi:MAG TPA: hypothetical protein VMX55_12405 [candidate division Zixibacteria bacterium]|nr:hypothetical protein [candidate division Zixibacteria bacterium]
MTYKWSFVKENLHSFIILNINLIIALLDPSFVNVWLVDYYFPPEITRFNFFEIVAFVTAYLLLIYLFLVFFPRLRLVNFILDLIIVALQIFILVFAIISIFPINIYMPIFGINGKIPFIIAIAILTMIDRLFEIAEFIFLNKKKILLEKQYNKGFDYSAEK